MNEPEMVKFTCIATAIRTIIQTEMYMDWHGRAPLARGCDCVSVADAAYHARRSAANAFGRWTIYSPESTDEIHVRSRRTTSASAPSVGQQQRTTRASSVTDSWHPWTPSTTVSSRYSFIISAKWTQWTAGDILWRLLSVCEQSINRLRRRHRCTASVNLFAR